MKPLIVSLPGNEALLDALVPLIGGERGHLETRHFPDGESYIRFVDDPAGRIVILLCTLAQPNSKILDLLFAAATARELGAVEVGLVAPYLAYMRQDRRFKPGEAVTSREVARLVSQAFEWLVTVDPHLHRYSSLGELYTIPCQVVHAAPAMSAWIRANVTDPILIGPDIESEQWVAAVARDAGAPFTVLEKTRLGDRDVRISIRDSSSLQDRTPVFIDDIISSGRTMLEAIRLIDSRVRPVCIAVHGIFADHADEMLTATGARLITCNTIPHASNAIEVQREIAESTRRLI